MKLKNILKSLVAVTLALTMCVFPAQVNTEVSYATTVDFHYGRVYEEGDWKYYLCLAEGCGGCHITEYMGKKTTVEVPEKIGERDVTYIEGGSFSSKVKKIIIPDCVTTIAFHISWNLPDVTIVSSEDSYAHEYAVFKNLKWKNLDEIVGDVKNLKQAASYTTSSIKLSWDKVNGAKGYEIYRAPRKNGQYEKIGTTKNLSYKCRKLKSGTNYYFRVRAFKEIKGKKVYGAYSNRIKMSTKTESPNIKLIATGNKVKISWKKVTGSNGYEVYMSTSKKGKYEKIKKTAPKYLSYTKNNLEKNKRYYFKVRSVKNVNGEKIYSAWSSIKSIKVK